MSHHPSFKVPLITFGLLIVLTGVGYFVAKGTNKLPPVHDAKIVIISHDDIQQIVPSKQDTVGQLIKKLDIKINPGDVIEPSPTTHINQDQFRINIYRAVPVEIVDGDTHTFTFSASKTPRAIAQQVGTQLYPEDAITTRPVQDFLKTGAVGEQVIVNRSVPVDVDLYGTKVTLRTQAKTVGGLIREKGIKLVKDDQIVPGPETPIAGLQHLSLIRTGVKTETLTENIAMPVQRINDPTLAYGTTAIRQQGSPGQQIVTYEVNIVNNVETARKAIQTVVTKAPVTQIVVVGISLAGIKGDMALAGIAPGDYNYADYIISHESGWNPQAQNASGAYGLCQALPGSKMSSAGSDWASNPVTQLRWCDGYAKGHYGSWAGAYSFWVSHRYW
jgi:uncharacterized protein YabE (DUF348 family)